MRLEKEGICKFLKKLNRQLLLRYSEMKTEFDRSPPANHEIKKRFLDWKSKYDELVITTLKECLEVDQRNFDFKEFIVNMTDEFGGEQDFLELLRNLNSSIETLKDFIRVNLVKDPTIYDEGV